MLHKLVITSVTRQAKVTIHICENKYNPEERFCFGNLGPLIIVLYKNIVLCAKIMCAIHAYHIDDQGHLTLVAQHV